MTSIFAIPLIVYKDVANVAEWLQDTFGFTIHRIVSDKNRAIIPTE